MSDYTMGDIREAIGAMRTLMASSDKKTQTLSKIVLGNGSLQESIAYQTLHLAEVVEALSTRMLALENAMNRLDKRCLDHHKLDGIILADSNASPKNWPDLVWKAISSKERSVKVILAIIATAFALAFLGMPNFRSGLSKYLWRSAPAAIEQVAAPDKSYK
jgi:hypothetical protein